MKRVDGEVSESLIRVTLGRSGEKLPHQGESSTLRTTFNRVLHRSKTPLAEVSLNKDGGQLQIKIRKM